MRAVALMASGFAHNVLAARFFLNEPDTGIEDALPDLKPGELPELSTMVGLPDFEYAARNYLPIRNYTYYRNGAAGEWSYRNNLEVFQRYRFNPRVMVDVTNVESTFSTSILGYNFSAPFFIGPAARGDLGHPLAELNLMRAAAAEDILYILYLAENETETQKILNRIETAGAKAIGFTVDSAADGNRQRASRFDVGSALTNMTSLPIVLKGIMSVEDARAAVEHGVPAIWLSNHGGRQLDGSPSSLEVALDIHETAPEIFTQIEVYADGGVRYGTDILKLLALGVKAVGLSRSFMFANVFGQEGVERAIQILKREIANDAGNLGVPDLKKIDASYVRQPAI
ncbi:FMN-dependent dehydrogenase [Colletotrichum tofieldiae]|uniref:FMN-dependent dehydrogenase n=1 Tax=Colletotrichum tofieldiae TaxID=708197 RepID=A0A166WBF5_9PEZI|nr:FMN-dependent dehydrogenase [Colletotrichum tofieldiae]